MREVAKKGSINSTTRTDEYGLESLRFADFSAIDGSRVTRSEKPSDKVTNHMHALSCDANKSEDGQPEDRIDDIEAV